MDPRATERVRKSWLRLESRQEELARLFYERLFSLDPPLRDLFAATDMESQPQKFLVMLAELVRLAATPDDFERVLTASGTRHRGYGVTPRHYRTAGEALLWAMEQLDPSGMDTDTREAWAEAYTRMASLMQRAPD